MYIVTTATKKRNCEHIAYQIFTYMVSTVEYFNHFLNIPNLSGVSIFLK